VTAESFIDSSNTEVATVDKAGLVTTIRRGETTMLARYEGAYAASTIVSMGDRGGFAWNNPPAFNKVDELVYAKLQRVKVLPSELCSDADFVRRVYIDVTGLPPEPEVVRAFLADKRDTRAKRDELIDKLVGSPDYVEQWTNKWADLLEVNRKFLGDVGAKALRDYIRKAVAENKPYDKFAYEVLTAKGSNAAIGAQNIHWKDEGAFTGETSAAQLLALGIKHVIIGHSERRQYFGETDDTVNLRLKMALENGFTPICCVGEVLEEREAGMTDDVLRRQCMRAFHAVSNKKAAKLVVAYEPVWAIGTGLTPTVGDVEQIHRFIRDSLIARFKGEGARIRILYGGSVKPSNARELMAVANVNGALVGGASLKAADFLAIARGCP